VENQEAVVRDMPSGRTVHLDNKKGMGTMDEQKEKEPIEAEVMPQKAEEPMLQRIIRECENAPGYVLFAGILTENVNADGNRAIQFFYTREHFSLEDTAKATKAFRKHLHQDMENAE
jgi:hypothetical protein